MSESTPHSEEQLDELRRRHRVSDQLISMHATLRDMYARRALLLDIVIIVTSVALVSLVFVDPVIVSDLEWSSTASRLTIGGLGIANFIFALVAWKVDWKGLSQQHAKAAQGFTQCKFELNACLTQPPVSGTEIAAAMARYEEIGRLHDPIPESKFIALKARYRTKVLLSRYLDRHPEMSIWILRLRLKIRHTCRALRHRDPQ